MTNEYFVSIIIVQMKNVVQTILIAAIVTAPVAAHANCTNPTYKKNHPYECRVKSTSFVGTGLALAGAAAIGGVAAMALGGGSGGGGGSTPAPAAVIPTPTLNTYNYVGGDVSEFHLASVMSDAKYIRNQAQYDSIRLAYSLARGYTGKNSTIAVLDSDSWHGRAVADVAMGPIAPDAVVEKYAIAGTDNIFMSYNAIGDVVARAAHANIINSSWNVEMGANNIRSRDQIIRLTDSNFINNMASAARGGTIFVWAAGNEGAAQSGALSALPRVVSELQGHFINVVAWDDNTGALADYSNACGVTMEYCITAPGTGIATDDRVVSGTSFAAPVVSAAVAVLREAFPYMTTPEITHLLFTTARDLGAPGVDEVYGHGMLDLERATRPVGTELVPLAAGGTTPLRTARAAGVIGRKIKDSNLKLAFVDDYGRAFETKLGDHVKIKNHGRGYEHLRPGKTSAHAGIVEFGFRRSDFLASDGLLGTDERNVISFIAINSEFNAGPATISLRPEIGATRPRGRTDSMITKFSNIYTASIATEIRHGDWALGVALPDMILSGDMNMRMPIGRAANGSLIFQDAKTSLAGTAAVEYSMRYKFITAAFVDNPVGTDEIYVIAKHKLAF